MKILRQTGIIFGLCFIGEGISRVLPIPFPASVISMLLLLLLLLTKRLKSQQLTETSDFLKHSMVLMFIPSGVGVIQVFGSIKDSLPQLVAVCVLSTIITFTVTAYTVKGVMFIQDQIRSRGNPETSE